MVRRCALRNKSMVITEGAIGPEVPNLAVLDAPGHALLWTDKVCET